VVALCHLDKAPFIKQALRIPGVYGWIARFRVALEVGCVAQVGPDVAQVVDSRAALGCINQGGFAQCGANYAVIALVDIWVWVALGHYILEDKTRGARRLHLLHSVEKVQEIIKGGTLGAAQTAAIAHQREVLALPSCNDEPLGSVICSYGAEVRRGHLGDVLWEQAKRRV